MQLARAAQKACSGGMALHGSSPPSLPPAVTRLHHLQLQQMAARKPSMMPKPTLTAGMDPPTAACQVLLHSQAAAVAMRYLQSQTLQLPQPCPLSLLKQCWNATTASIMRFLRVHLFCRYALFLFRFHYLMLTMACVTTGNACNAGAEWQDSAVNVSVAVCLKALSNHLRKTAQWQGKGRQPLDVQLVGTELFWNLSEHVYLYRESMRYGISPALQCKGGWILFVQSKQHMTCIANGQKWSCEWYQALAIPCMTRQ